MRIVVNGQLQEHQDAISVAELVRALALDPRRVAVELNKKIVRRADFEKTRLAENDSLEIVTLVGGG
ncbi:MAG TPA: sulfur carrier protein ThiS [Phycisphaerae bacterium]|nr:sulfur carrier protein ThiS [Phycisphaerae bacterium]